jgi:hypothetical protein
VNDSTPPAPALADQAREHHWSANAEWAPLSANGAAPILARFCTRNDCGITEVSHQDAPSSCNGYDEIVMTYRNDGIGAVIVVVGSAFDLRWTDYVANEWAEPFESLSAAVARLAALIYCGEADPERMFTTDDPAQFAAAVAEFHRANTA